MTLALLAFAAILQPAAHAEERAPRLGDCIHFILYNSYPVPDDPTIIGQERAGHVTLVHPDGRINLHYSPAGLPNEPDNPPLLTERKIWRAHGAVGELNTWHFCAEDH